MTDSGRFLPQARNTAALGVSTLQGNERRSVIDRENVEGVCHQGLVDRHEYITVELSSVESATRTDDTAVDVRVVDLDCAVTAWVCRNYLALLLTLGQTYQENVPANLPQALYLQNDSSSRRYKRCTLIRVRKDGPLRAFGL